MRCAKGLVALVLIPLMFMPAGYASIQPQQCATLSTPIGTVADKFLTDPQLSFSSCNSSVLTVTEKKAIEALYTPGSSGPAHMRRVTAYAERLAAELGLPPQLINALQKAGLTHDLNDMTYPSNDIKYGSAKKARELLTKYVGAGKDIPLDTIKTFLQKIPAHYYPETDDEAAYYHAAITYLLDVGNIPPEERVLMRSVFLIEMRHELFAVETLHRHGIEPHPVVRWLIMRHNVYIDPDRDFLEIEKLARSINVFPSELVLALEVLILADVFENFNNAGRSKSRGRDVGSITDAFDTVFMDKAIRCKMQFIEDIKNVFCALFEKRDPLFMNALINGRGKTGDGEIDAAVYYDLTHALNGKLLPDTGRALYARTNTLYQHAAAQSPLVPDSANKNIRLILSDIDGTIKDENGYSNDIIDLYFSYMKAGGIVGFVTGRKREWCLYGAFGALRKRAREEGVADRLWFFYENGGGGYENAYVPGDEKYHAGLIDYPEEAKRFSIAQQKKLMELLEVQFSPLSEWFMDVFDAHRTDGFKQYELELNIVPEKATREHLCGLKNAVARSLTKVGIDTATMNMLDEYKEMIGPDGAIKRLAKLMIGPQEVNKGVVVDFASDFFDVKPENILALGDSVNDIDMLAKPGIHGVLVGPVTDEVQEQIEKEEHFNDAVLFYAEQEMRNVERTYHAVRDALGKKWGKIIFNGIPELLGAA